MTVEEIARRAAFVGQEARRHVQAYGRFLTEQVPGYATSYLLGTSVWIGARETRRLHGPYVLTREDDLAACDSDDAIARCGAPVEDHAGGESTIWDYVGSDGLPSGLTYGIPFGCLCPADLDNVLAAGRCLSATHDGADLTSVDTAPCVTNSPIAG